MLHRLVGGQHKRLVVFDNVRDLSVGHDTSTLTLWQNEKRKRCRGHYGSCAPAPDRHRVSRPMTLGLRTIDMVYLPLQRLNGALILALRVC
jgi:hypothetical protein